MRLKTKTDVTFNDGIKGQSTGKVIGMLGSIVYENDFTKIGVNCGYFKEDGTKLIEFPFFLHTADKINEMFTAIQPTLPPFANEVQNTQAKFMEGFKFLMAETFGITVADIEIID